MELSVEDIDADLLAEATEAMARGDRRRGVADPLTPAEVINDALQFVIARWY